MSFLCILDVNSLSVKSFASIFSHSVGCLFVLLMVSFAVKKAGTFKFLEVQLCHVSSQLHEEVRVAGLHFTEGTGAQRGKTELRLIKGVLAPRKAGW